MILPPDLPLNEDVVRQHVAPYFSYSLDRGMAPMDDEDPFIAVGYGFQGCYLANHSLGRPPDETYTNLLRAMRLWYALMDECWEDDRWMSEVDRFRSLVAGLLDLDRADCVVPKTSAGQGLRAVLNAFPQDRPVNVVATTGEFDSIDFILKSYADRGRANVGWVGPTSKEGPVPLFTSQAVCEAVTPGTDLVVVSSVFFTTGQVMSGIEDIVSRAHSVGALVLVDAYHAVGVLPFDMPAIGTDFVIGGSYKYLRGGPGACYLAIAPRIVDEARLVTLDTGWFAKKDLFSYARPESPERASGGDAWLESTPPVMTAYQANPGINIVAYLGVGRLRDYSLRQQALLREQFLLEGTDVFVPDDPSAFGAFTLVPHPDPEGLVVRLRERGVTVDARGPFVRFGPDVLTSSNELRAAARATAEAWN